MAKQLVLALLCAAVAVAAARELTQAKVSVSELPKQLQELNTRCENFPPLGPTASQHSLAALLTGSYMVSVAAE